MKNFIKQLPMMLVCPLLLIVLGCGFLGGGTRQATRFFILKSIPDPAASPISPTGAKDTLSIGIGPVRLPDSLNRQQMVTRVNENEVCVEPFYRWAAPLTENITAVLAENLSSRLNTNRVIPFPWAVSSRPAYQVRITVVDFIGTLGGEATLEVRWVLTRGEEQRELANRHSRFKATVPSFDHGAMVAAQSRLLSDFSGEIAQVVSRSERD